MATYTDNFNLIKPSEDDFYDIQDMNENMDTLDGVLEEMEQSQTLLAQNQEEVQSGIDVLTQRVGTPDDVGEDTLFGLMKQGGEEKFYHFSTTEKEVVLDQEYSTKYNSKAGAVLLGRWFAQRSGVVTIGITYKCTTSGDDNGLRAMIYNFKYDCGTYTTYDETSAITVKTEMINMPVGSTVTPFGIETTGCTFIDDTLTGTTYKTRQYTMHVHKGDTLFIFLGNRDSSGGPGYCKHVGIAYADEEEV